MKHAHFFRFTRDLSLLRAAAAGFFFFGCLVMRREVIGSSSVIPGTTLGSVFRRDGMARKRTPIGDILTRSWLI